MCKIFSKIAHICQKNTLILTSLCEFVVASFGKLEVTISTEMIDGFSILTAPICIYGKLMLNISLISANQTSRTLVMTNVPKLPWSLDRFQIPDTVLYTCSCGRTFSCCELTTALLSFNSRYNTDDWYNLNSGKRMCSKYIWFLRKTNKQEVSYELVNVEDTGKLSCVIDGHISENKFKSWLTACGQNIQCLGGSS